MTTKICSACGAEKQLTTEFFQKRALSADGFLGRCKDCDNSGRKKSNRYHRLAKEQDTGIRICGDCNTGYPLDEFTRADGNMRSRCNRCHNIWQSKNRTKNKSLDVEFFTIRENLNSARKRSKKNGWNFNIKIEDLQPFPTKCEVFGIDLVYGQGSLNDNTASLDKVIPSKGYIKGNVRIISRKANFIKKDATLEQLKHLVAYVDRHTKG